MYVFTILSALICIQLVTIASCESNDVSPNLLQSEPIFDNNEDLSNSNSESDEENDNVRRLTSFLRFGRRMPSSSGTFLRFGRQMSPTSGSFLRFGRSNPSILRFDRAGQSGAKFLRFGRRGQQIPSSNIHRFSRKGEFLRFG